MRLRTTVSYQCYQGEPKKADCRHKVKHTFPCGHSRIIECFAREEEKCLRRCPKELQCGHLCPNRCYQCLDGHAECKQKCAKILICEHKCDQKHACSVQCTPCVKKCKSKCVHNRCNHKCGEACIPCVEKCEWKCAHHSCSKL